MKTLAELGPAQAAYIIGVIVFRPMTALNESIMKTDRRGRLRYTPEQKKTMIEPLELNSDQM